MAKILPSPEPAPCITEMNWQKEGKGQAREDHGCSVEVTSEGQGNPKTTGQVQNGVGSPVETSIHIERVGSG